MGIFQKLRTSLTSIFKKTEQPHTPQQHVANGHIRDFKTAVNALHHASDPVEILNAIRFIKTRTLVNNNDRSSTSLAISELRTALENILMYVDPPGDINIKASLIEALSTIRISKAKDSESINRLIIPAFCSFLIGNDSNITAKQMAVYGLKCTQTESDVETVLISDALQIVKGFCDNAHPDRIDVKVLGDKIQSTLSTYNGYTPKIDRTASPSAGLL